MKWLSLTCGKIRRPEFYLFLWGNYRLEGSFTKIIFCFTKSYAIIPLYINYQHHAHFSLKVWMRCVIYTINLLEHTRVMRSRHRIECLMLLGRAEGKRTLGRISARWTGYAYPYTVPSVHSHFMIYDQNSSYTRGREILVSSNNHKSRLRVI